ncbi:hypothetical protein [Vibrio atypicus]|jgi:uncharacterized Zn finger protein|uniref:hypothetical protein n=1 Tax=Vibrio atypicus TaxID=558271 RepID=UPI00135A885F|nr:hypothetical protein [Vibrio atypicus]
MSSSRSQDKSLCCPLCGSEEYLLSDKNNMLCAECGSFFEDVDKIVVHQPPVQLLIQSRMTRVSTNHAYH